MARLLLKLTFRAAPMWCTQIRTDDPASHSRPRVFRSLDVSMAESARSGFPIKRALPSAGRTHAEDVYSGDRWPPANFPTQKVGDVHPLGCERFLLPTDTPGVGSNPSRPEFGSPEPPSASILACIEANLRTPRPSALPAGGRSAEHHLASG